MTRNLIVTPSQPATLCVRALHVLAALRRGGAETWLMDVVRNSDRHLLEIDVCLIGEGNGAFEAEFKALGGRIYRCHLGRNVFRFTRSFRQLLREQGFDVVHSHLYLFSGAVLRAAKLEHVPRRIAHIHPIEDIKRSQFFRPLYLRWMRRWMHRYGTHFVAPSLEGLDRFWGSNWVGDGNRMPLFNGVQVSRFARSGDRAAVRAELGLPPEAKIVLNVARFAPHKRQLFLVDVAEHLLSRRDDVYFLLVGDGPLRDRTMTQVAQNGRSDHFRFLAGAADIDRFWLASDAFAFPSNNEGFGIVVAEAGAAGLPVVAQDIPGVREAAKACHSATLLPLTTQPSDWSRILEKALNQGPLPDPQRRAWLATFPFTIERSVAALQKLYGLDPASRSHLA